MPACTTPELWPVWCTARRFSFSSTVTSVPGRRRPISRATASPRMPPPTTPTVVTCCYPDLALVAEVHDRGHRTAAVGSLVRRRHRHEHRRVAGDRSGDATYRGLDLAVPVHVGVVEHRVAATADVAVL